VLLAFAGCGSDQTLEYDLEPIPLGRAPLAPGGEALGGLLAKVNTAAGLEPLLIDSAFPFSSLVAAGCPTSAPPGWTYTGSIDLYGWTSQTPARRASFRNVGLFDRCPGPTGDAATQPAGVVGSPLLANFAVDLSLPRSSAVPALMRLWPGFPGTDDQIAQAGFAVLRFEPRGGAVVAKPDGQSSVSLPNTRIVLAACAAPRVFSTSEVQETCATGEVALKASGGDLQLALGTGEGPLILSAAAWARLAARLGMPVDAGATGELFTPFSSTATPARFLTLARLALFQGAADAAWSGACAELARARRIEWVLANQDQGACFQPCDASGGQALTTRSYLEIGGPLALAVVSETSAVIQALNVDMGARPQVDGIIGAAALAGTRLRLDYPSQPSGRVIASCLDSTTRDACLAVPGCPGLSAQGQTHVCFGQPPRGWAPVCN